MDRNQWNDITSTLMSPVYVHVATHTQEESIRLFGTLSARLTCANAILALARDRWEPQPWSAD